MAIEKINNNGRRIYRVIDHAIDHIKSGSKELAINLLQTEMDKDRGHKRRRGRNMLKPSTIFAFMIYGTFCYLAIIGKIKPEAIIAIVSALMTFYYSKKIQEGANGKNN